MDVSTTALILADCLLLGLSVALAAVSIGPAWDPIARRQIADLIPAMKAVGIDDSRLSELLRWWGLALVGSVVLMGVVLNMPLLAIPTALLIFLSPRAWFRARLDARRKLMRDQMATAAVAIANAARAGLSLSQALETTVRETPDPLALELGRIVREYQGGIPLAEAIESARERVRLDSFNLFTAPVLACLERGGRITEALDGISRSLLEARRLERRLDADTASGRKVIWLLAAFPLVFLAGFYAVDPDNTGLLFTTLPGQIVLLAVILLIYASVKVAERIMNIQI